MPPVAAQIGGAIAQRGQLSRVMRLVDHLSTMVCGLAIALFLSLLLAAALGYQALVDYSGSMRPTIAAGDLLVTRSEAATSVHRGAIVSFRDPGLGGRLVTHRVIGISDAGQRIAFLTRGDANSVPERWTVPRAASVTRMILDVPSAGHAVAWFADPWVRTGLLLLGALLLGSVLLRRIWAV